MPIPTPARMIKIRRRRDPATPKDTTHVLEHLPAFLNEPDETGGQGNWGIQTLADHLAGTLADPPGFDGPAGLSEPDLIAFTEGAMGYPVTLTRFEMPVSTSNGRQASVEPAFWITRRNPAR